MSKSLPEILLVTATVASIAGCGPTSAALVEVDPDPRADQGDDVHSSPRMDASRADASDGAVMFGPGELEDPEGCLVLPDQTWAQVYSADASVGLVVGRRAETEGCTSDAGAPWISIYHRRDDQPLIERGQPYSYRWQIDQTIVTKVRVEGGEASCDTRSIVYREGIRLNGIIPVTCYDFVAPFDAHYLRTYGGDYWGAGQLSLGTHPLQLKLCRAPCPPGTAVADDAGAPAQDASSAIPGLATNP